MPTSWTAEHSASTINAPGIGNSSSTVGLVYRDSHMKRLAFNDSTLFVNSDNHGVLEGPFHLRIVVLFEAALVAVILGDNCQQYKLPQNISAYWPQDCFGQKYNAPFVDTVDLGMGRLKVSIARWILSDPGHFTLIVDSVVPADHTTECSKLADQAKILNGNLVPIIEFRQNFWNIQEGVKDSSVFDIPSDCQSVSRTTTGVFINHPFLDVFMFGL